MSFYKLITQFNDRNAAVAQSLNTGPYDNLIFSVREINHWDEKEMVFTIGNHAISGLRDVLQNNMDYLLVSNRLKEAIEKNGIKGISFYKITLNQEIDNFTPYWFGQLEYVEDAFDYDQSDYNWYGDPPKVAGLTKAVLKEKSIGSLDFFRIPENEPAEYVSQKFKDLFEKNRFTGVEFLKLKTV
jgi:hypothetical protein